MNSTGNARGALFMAIAMAAFTCNDALVKSVTHTMNTGQILFVRGLMTSALVLVIAWRMGALGSWRILLQGPVALRLLAEIFASLTFISALGVMPLANISAILQSLPLAVTLGAALFLGGQAARHAVTEQGVVGAVAAPLFQTYLVPFELTSILLLVAIIGAVVLAKRRI